MSGGRIRPVLLVGAGRSGTTALCRALDNHSQIAIAPGESPLLQYIGQLAAQYRTGGSYHRDSSALNETTMRKSLRALALNCVWGDSAEATIERLMVGATGIAGSQSIQLWGAKAFPDRESATGLEWLFPSVRFVYIFRSGIDAVFSMSKFPGFAHLSFSESCAFWAERVFLYDYLRHDDRAIAVRFEDFLEDPKDVLSRICLHVGLPYEDSVAHFAATHLIHPLDQETALVNPRSALGSREPAQQHWSAEQKQTFRDICSEAMRVLAYSIDL